MHDAVELERRGIPTVVVATPGFVPLAAEQASALGLAGLRVLSVPVLTGLEPDAVRRLGQELARQAGWKGGTVGVEEVLVMSSELRPQGPVYTVLSRARLGGAG